MAKAWASEFNAKMRPITKEQHVAARKNAAKYIFVKDKDGNAMCQRCEREFVISGTKHLEKCKCPKCKQPMQIQHVWRMKSQLMAINWIVVPKVLDSKTLVLRYICGCSIGCEPIQTDELARMYISEDHSDAEYYCERQGNWAKTKSPYFVPWFMSYRDNHWFCMYGNLYKPNASKKEFSKLDCFKYYGINEHYDDTRIVSQMHYLVKFARLNEKLEKVGMQNLVDENFRSYCNNTSTIAFNKKKTSLIEMLRLDRVKYNAFKKNPNMSVLKELQCIKNFNEKEYTEIASLVPEVWSRRIVHEIARDFNLNAIRIARYAKANSISVTTYHAYLNRIKQLGWIMNDEYYVFPRNFEEFDDKSREEMYQITEQERRKKVLEDAKREAGKTAIIAMISNIIRTAPELQDMFADAEHGLKIYVPESVADLYMSGLVMHNCLSTYAERIVQKETLVFFIRRIEEPDKDYVAFEYNNGIVKQIYESYNHEVTDNNVIKFAEAFTERLNEIDIMNKIAM